MSGFARFLKYLAPSAVCLIHLVVAAAEEIPDLRIVFGNRSALVEGAIGSEESAAAIVGAIVQARPDLAIDRIRLTIDPSRKSPPVGDLRSLLSEIGLSTHEGRLELWPDRVVLGGLTDSLVTVTALKIRLEPILDGRTLVNRICIVGSDYLPQVTVASSDGPAPPSEPSASTSARPSIPFSPPGLLPEKLVPALILLTNLERLTTGTASPPSTVPQSSPPSNPPVNPAMPSAPPSSPPSLPLVAVPVREFESLPSIFFSRNSFLLQANQVPNLDSIAKHLLSQQRRGAPIFLEPVKPSGGSSAFNDYLCERRAGEVGRLLSERGIDLSTISTRTILSSSPVDSGEVRLRVEILPPPPQADPGTGVVEGPTPVGTPSPTNPGTPAPTESTSPER